MATKHPLPRIPPMPGERRKSRAEQLVCFSKRQFVSKEAAKQPGSKVYRCPVCNWFHRATDHRYVKKLVASRAAKRAARLAAAGRKATP